MSLVVVENPLDTWNLLARPLDQRSIVALTPHAAYALEKTGAAFTTVESATDIREIEDRGIHNFARVESFCDAIDRAVQSCLPVARQGHLRPASSMFFFMKILFDSVSLRLAELQPVIKEKRPHRVSLCRPQNSTYDERLFWYDESAYSRVVQLLSEMSDTPVDEVDPVSESDSSHGPWRRHQNGLKARSRRALVRAKVTLCGLATVLRGSCRFGVDRTQRIVFGTRGYGLDGVVSFLLRNSHASPWIWEEHTTPYPIREWPIPTTRNGTLPPTAPHVDACARAWEILERDRRFRDIFRDDEITWFGLVEPRLRSFVCESIPKYASAYLEAKRQLKQIRPIAFVPGMTISLWSRAVCAAARTLGIPVVGIHHGEIGTHHLPIFYYTDLSVADWYLVGGKGVARYIERHYPESTKTRVVGLPMLDQLSSSRQNRNAIAGALGLDPTRRVVVYNMTTLDGNYRYATGRQPPDGRQFEIHRRMLDLFVRFPKVQFVFKAHPARGARASPIETVISDQKPSNCTVVWKQSFVDLLGLADAFVIDCPSTSLLQMASTDTPIYIFNDWFQWEPEAVEAIRKRAFLYENLDEFCSSFARDLATGACFARQKTDRSLWKMYAVDEDNKAARRIGTFLLSELPR